jgi:hypothetical protein
MLSRLKWLMERLETSSRVVASDVADERAVGVHRDDRMKEQARLLLDAHPPHQVGDALGDVESGILVRVFSHSQKLSFISNGRVVPVQRPVSSRPVADRAGRAHARHVSRLPPL